MLVIYGLYFLGAAILVGGVLILKRINEKRKLKVLSEAIEQACGILAKDQYCDYDDITDLFKDTIMLEDNDMEEDTPVIKPKKIRKKVKKTKKNKKSKKA